ncbi:hypothetical protein [Vreelandella glaciei]|uniref:hypothetical protein n=1 Tax=Vreelandella glaciei TaxID=186761 RepID=UPI0030EDDFF0
MLSLFVIAPLMLNAQEFPIESHVDACGDGSQEMSDKELSEMHACTLRQRDAMGYLMDRWEGYSPELREACLARSQEGNKADYVALHECLKDT